MTASVVLMMLLMLVVMVRWVSVVLMMLGWAWVLKLDSDLADDSVERADDSDSAHSDSWDEGRRHWARLDEVERWDLDSDSLRSRGRTKIDEDEGRERRMTRRTQKIHNHANECQPHEPSVKAAPRSHPAPHPLFDLLSPC